MRLVRDVLVVLIVSLAVLFLIHIAYAVLRFVSSASEDTANKFLEMTNGTADVSLMFTDISPLVQVLEFGLIICFVAMIIAVFMYSRRR